MPSVGIVPGLDEVEHGHSGLGLITEAFPLNDSVSRAAKQLSLIALSYASPTEPIEGRTLASLQRSPKAMYNSELRRWSSTVMAAIFVYRAHIGHKERPHRGYTAPVIHGLRTRGGARG